MILKMLKLSFKTHQQKFQYQITSQMIKIVYGTNKIITNNKYLVYFHGKNIPKK